MANNSKATSHVTQSVGNANNPYVGPRPFTQADQDIFFGRNQEAIELTSLVKAHPEVLLYAQSGAGKTSLLFAQVITILYGEEEFDVLPTARVSSQESAAIPEDKITNIYMFNAFKDLSDDKLSVIERTQLTLAEYLERHPRPPVKSAPSSEAGPIEEKPELRLPRVIIFDQFEEIFTLYPERYKDRQDFFAQVSAALEADPFLRVIFSMREDYIAELDPYVDILPQNLRTRFRLERLRKVNAISAVKQPLETNRVKGRRQFAPGAAELLVDRLLLIKVKTASGEKIEVPGEFVDPVQLQVVCQTLWEKLPPEKTIITKEDLDKYADVDEALSVFYETSVRKAVTAANIANQTVAAKTAKPVDVSTITEGAVRGWFEQKLITREGKRNMVFREGEVTAGLSNVVVDELENQHVIRLEMRGGEPWYELSHDRFIPPIRESNRRFMLKQPEAQRKALELEARADEWLKSQRSVSLLFNRAELLDAQDWMVTEAAAIGFSETLFSLVRASEAAIEHEDSKQQQMLAEAQQQRMIAEQQRSKQMKIGFVVVSLLLVCALGATIYAYKAKGEANRAATRASAEKTRAELALSQLKIESAKVEEQRKKAVDAQTQAEFSQKATEKAKGDLQIALADTAQKNTDLTRQSIDLRNATIQLSAATLVLKEEAAARELRSNSLKLALEANSQLASDPELALRLALEATKFENPPEQAKSILRQAYLNSTTRSILKGHTKKVWQASYSPDGQFIFTASEDGTLKMWDAKTNRELKTFAGQEQGVHAIAISADSTRVATEANAKGRLWNVTDGTSFVLDALTGPVAAIAFSPNGRLIATEATSDTEDRKKAGAEPRIWDVGTKKIRQTLKGHELAVVALAFSPNSDLLVTASWDKTARIWDVATGRELKVLVGHTAPLDSVAFDPTGNLVVTGSYDGTARVWDVASGKETFVLKRHTGGVRTVAFSPNGRLILTVGQRVTSLTPNFWRIPLPPEMPAGEAAPPDNTVRVWDAQNGAPITVMTELTNEIDLAVFSADSKMIATATKDGTVRVRRAATGEDITKFLGHTGNVNSIAFSPDGKFVLTAGDDRNAQVWKVATASSFAQPIASGTREYRYVRFDSTGEVIVTASTDSSVRFRKLTGESKASFRQPSGPVYDIAISPDYKFAVTASRRLLPVSRDETPKSPDSDAHVWNLETNEVKDLKQPVSTEPVEQSKLAPPGNPALPKSAPVKKVVYSPKGNYVLTVTDNGTARVWKTSDWTSSPEFKIPEEHEGPGAWAFDPSEKYLVTAASSGNITIWEIPSVEVKSSIKTRDKGIVWVAFNDSADLLVTASSDSTARVWTREGKAIATFSGHRGDVLSAEFSRDGKFIVTAGDDGTVRVWDVDAGSPVSVFKIHEDIGVLRASFSPDGKSIVAGDLLGFVYVLDCEMCRPFKDILKLADELNPRQLTSDEMLQYLSSKSVLQRP
jgi:WD40 repeat protein